MLGPNDGAVKLITPDGFTTQQTIDDAGSASAGMYMSVAGQPIDKFQGAARTFADELLAGVPEREDDRPVRDLRWPGGHGHARRDRRLRRLAQRRDREDVRDQGQRTACSARSRSTRTAIRRAASGAVVAITIYKATRQARDRARSSRRSRRRSTRRSASSESTRGRLGWPDTARWREGIALPPHICLESPGDEQHPGQASRREHHRPDRALPRRSRRPLARRQLRQGADRVHQHRPDRPHDRARSTVSSRSATRSSTASCS